MQIRTADFAPYAATWRTRPNILVVFDSLRNVKHDVIHKPEISRNCNVVRGDSSMRGHIVKCTDNFVKSRRVIEICERTDTQTHIQTY